MFGQHQQTQQRKYIYDWLWPCGLINSKEYSIMKHCTLLPAILKAPPMVAKNMEEERGCCKNVHCFNSSSYFISLEGGDLKTVLYIRWYESERHLQLQYVCGRRRRSTNISLIFLNFFGWLSMFKLDNSLGNMLSLTNAKPKSHLLFIIFYFLKLFE